MRAPPMPVRKPNSADIHLFHARCNAGPNGSLVAYALNSLSGIFYRSYPPLAIRAGIPSRPARGAKGTGSRRPCMARHGTRPSYGAGFAVNSGLDRCAWWCVGGFRRVSLLFLVALTGIERVLRQFRWVQFGLSDSKHVQSVPADPRQEAHGTPT